MTQLLTMISTHKFPSLQGGHQPEELGAWELAVAQVGLERSKKESFFSGVVGGNLQLLVADRIVHGKAKST